MARPVSCLGAVVLIGAGFFAALIWDRLPVVRADPFWDPRAEGGGAGAPGWELLRALPLRRSGARARPEGAFPPSARARLGGASPPIKSGCLYSLLSFCSPIITMWSTVRSVEATYAFHGWFDLFASALGSFGWLLFAISQLHGEDGQIIGIAAVVVNAFGFAFYATYIVVNLAVAGYMGTKACLGVMLVFVGAYISAFIVSVYGPMKRESREAMIVSFVAFILQIISQSIPLFTVLANDVDAVLSFVSMGLHLVYALRPHAVDYPSAPAPQPQPLAKVRRLSRQMPKNG